MFIWSLSIFVEKNDPFLTYEPPKVSVLFVLVTGLVTDLASLVTDPVLALILSNSMRRIDHVTYICIYNVFKHLHMRWMGIWVHPTVIHVLVGATLWCHG
jgi:hypothetical protein